MAGVLRNVGFEVVEGTNLTRDKMTERLLEFGKKAQGADVAVFFYAGHGIAIGGINYLLPIDADIKSEMDVKLGAAINIDLTLDQTMGDAKVKLVFLDACRDNPFAAKIKSNSGATRSVVGADRPCRNEVRRRHPDRVRHRSRADRARRPGRHQQPVHPRADGQHRDPRHRDPAGDDQGPRPGQRGNQQGPIALGPYQPDRHGLSQSGCGARCDCRGALAAPVRRLPRHPSGSEVEVEFWRSVKESNKPEELNAYLTNYPNGQFRSLALARIASLQDGAAATATRNLTTGIDPATFNAEANQTTEDQIGLDKGQRRDVQRRLNGLGFDTKVTGTFDESTRSVITRWQAARGYPKSGYLNKLQHKALLTEIVATAPSALQRRRRGKAGAPRGAAPAAAQRSARRSAAAAAIPVQPSSAAWSAACWAARSGADRPIHDTQPTKSPAHAGLFRSA